MAFSEVVVPLDLSGPADAVLAVASAVARRASVGVRLVTVSSPGLDHGIDEADLAALGEKLDAPAVATAIIESNDVTDALLGTVEPDGLLCIETRARGPVTAALLGSATRALLAAATRPMLLVGPATDPDLPLGVLEVGLARPDLAEHVLPVVGAWARDLHLRVRLVHAQDGGGEPWPAADHDLRQLAAVLRQDFDVAVEVDVLGTDDVHQALVEDAARHDASLIAVGVHHRSWLQRATLGPVAAAVAHSSRAAVLAVPAPQPG